jgi:hypothetical protein
MRSPADNPFVRNLAAFTQALGVENAPAVFTFAAIGWPSDEVRNDFIKDMAGVDFRELDQYGP